MMSIGGSKEVDVDVVLMLAEEDPGETALEIALETTNDCWAGIDVAELS